MWIRGGISAAGKYIQPDISVHQSAVVALFFGPLRRKIKSGSLPTITEWISFKEETELLLSRFHSEQEKDILPILMCPDDSDLICICTIIVAEVTKTDNEVIWSRVGVDSSQLGTPYNYELIGTTVVWLDLAPEMSFLKSSIYRKKKQPDNPARLSLLHVSR
ncbi:hypothetical protein [Paenibacillus sp. PL2-23]|uniref:hypothetical protein n=1 Tax=Paenibacillus sp. PL2-23 TaxID=2100729 RepID=UPI0030F99690